MSQATIGAGASPSEAVIQSAIQEISHFATLPEITIKIIHLVEDPDSTAHDLNKIISNDQALGSRILKVVNSAFYGLPGQIGSINRAIMLLGLNAVKNIAIAASLEKLFRGGYISNTFDVRQLWTHSLAVATGTRLLASQVDVGLQDEAFLAGLIHDIGIMVEVQARPQQFVEVIEKIEKDPNLTFRQAEMQVLGANHEQFGSALCRRWKFPNSFIRATGFHHHPLELKRSSRMLTVLVHLADIMAANQNLGFSRSVEMQQIDPQLLVELNLTSDQVDKISELLPQAMEEATNLLSDT